VILDYFTKKIMVYINDPSSDGRWRIATITLIIINKKTVPLGLSLTSMRSLQLDQFIKDHITGEYFSL
jgi:hypothetical protein